MKTIIRHYAIDTFTLYLVSTIASGIIFQNGLQTLFLAGVGLMIASLLIKPIINVLLLPINLVTFGVFKWLSSAIALYLVTMVIPGLKIERFYYPGLVTAWIDIPQITFEGLMAFVAFSLLISFITSFFHWLVK
jgi:putative membrane protein